MIGLVLFSESSRTDREGFRNELKWSPEICESTSRHGTKRLGKEDAIDCDDSTNDELSEASKIKKL